VISIKNGGSITVKDSVQNMSLSLSEAEQFSAPRMDKTMSVPTNKENLLVQKQNTDGYYDNREQLLDDMSKLVKQNKELNETCAGMDDDI
jgi:hypothetical protein